MTKQNEIKSRLTKRELREVKELKDKVGQLMEGSNGGRFMCVLTALIGDAGVQWRDGTTKQAFIAETVEAISMWYDWYLDMAEEDEEDE